MSLSDCPECWDTPCTCGHEYKRWETQDIEKLVRVLNAELARRGPITEGAK